MKATKQNIKDLDCLKKRSDFLRVQHKNQKWISKSLILQTAPRTEDTHYHPRFGLTASRKLSKLAVDRNRVKRRLRAAARDILPLYAREDTDYVLIGRRETLTRSYDEICNDLKWCLKRLNLRKDKTRKDKAAPNA